MRRSNAHSAGLSRSNSAVVVDTDLVHRLQIARPKGSIGAVPAAGATRPAHRHLSEVWRAAAARGRAEKQLRQLHPGRRGSTRRTFAHVLARLARGESPDRSGVARAWIDTTMLPLPIAAILAGITAAGLAGPIGAMTVATVALTLVGAPAALVAANANLDRRNARPRRTRLAVAVIVLLEALAWWSGYVTSRVRPPAPRRRTWTGDRAEWLSELRWRLGLERLSVTTPVEPSPWDVDVRCGLFLRRMIVTAVAWQWTPHVRTALRFRPSVIVPVLAVAGVWSWSPIGRGDGCLRDRRRAGVRDGDPPAGRRRDRPVDRRDRCLPFSRPPIRRSWRWPARPRICSERQGRQESIFAWAINTGSWVRRLMPSFR